MEQVATFSKSSSAAYISSRLLRSLYRYLDETDTELCKKWCQAIPEIKYPLDKGLPIFWVPQSQAFNIWEKAYQLTQDTLLGHKVGKNFAFTDIDALGYAYMSCETLGEGYENTSRYYQLAQTGTLLNIHRKRSYFYLEFRDQTQSLAHPQHNLYVATAVLQGSQISSGQKLKPIRIRFPHERQLGHDQLQSFFQAPIEYSQAAIEVHFPDEYYNVPMAQPDHQLKLMMEATIQRLLSDVPSTNILIQKLQALIVVNMSNPKFSRTWLANQVGMNARTLDRRLAQYNLSFSLLLDQVRCAVAQSHIRQGQLSFTDISFHLGFSEPSVFSRRFKKWTGLNPSEYLSQQKLKDLKYVSDEDRPDLSATRAINRLTQRDTNKQEVPVNDFS